MSTEESKRLEHVILKAVEERGPGGAGATRLARELAKAISYDKGLQRLRDDDIRQAVVSASGDEYHIILAAIREAGKREADGGETPSGPENSLETVNEGFFLQCWDAYAKDGDLRRVRMLTVSFLARHLVSAGKYIADDEIDWCARRAKAEAERNREDESKAREAFDEAVVILVLQKFERSMRRNPEKTSALLEAWRKNYTEYSLRRYGKTPEYAKAGFQRNMAISPFRAAGA